MLNTAMSNEEVIAVIAFLYIEVALLVLIVVLRLKRLKRLKVLYTRLKHVDMYHHYAY